MGVCLGSLRIGVLCAAVLGCGWPATDPPPSRIALRAESEPLSRTHLLTGELAAARAVELTAPDVGVRPLEIRWMVENGTRVEAGDRLFEFENAGLASSLEQRRVAVEEARSRIASIESQSGTRVAQAEFELERQRAALEKARIDASAPRGLRSEEESRRLQLELQKAQRQAADAERLLRAARATAEDEVEKERLRLGKEEAGLHQVEAGLVELAVTAPIAGVVLVASNDQDRPWEVGDIAYPGHLLALLPDPSSLLVRARLFDVDDGKVEPGMPALVTLDAHPGLEFHGRVRTVDRVAFERRRASSTRVFWVVVDLESLDLEHMRPGMSVKVAVEGAPVQGNALLAPRQSLDLSDPAAPRALLADGSWRAVELGACTPLDCVVESGLEEGDRLGWVDGSVKGREPS